jgi:kynurenine formamidase
MSRYFDLSQPIENGMTFFPGDPEPRIAPATLEPPWQVTDLHLGTHTGTHIDAASHYIPAGRTIDQYPPERFILTGSVIPVQQKDDQAINATALQAGLKNLAPGSALLIHTGWDRFWKSERYLRHPYLSAEASRALVEAGVKLVGIDALNVDSTAQGTTHAHEILLGHDVLIVENLTHLDQLIPGAPYRFSFLPLLLAGLDGSPVRAVAWQVGEIENSY